MNALTLIKAIERSNSLKDIKDLVSGFTKGGDNLFGVTSEDLVSLQELEKLHIERTLVLTNGNKSQASKILGVTRTTLDRKIQKHDLERYL